MGLETFNLVENMEYVEYVEYVENMKNMKYHRDDGNTLPGISLGQAKFIP